VEVALLGPLERRVMSQLWQAGPSSVAEVLVALNDGSSPPLAYTTVMTTLTRLFGKQYVSRTKDGRGFRYVAAVDEAGLPTAAGKRELQQLIDRYGPANVATFAADLAVANPDLVRRLRELADDNDPTGGRA
jgi:predicted transcriptional regulator